MNIQELTEKVLYIRNLYAEYEKQKGFKPWTIEEAYTGLASDVGDLGRLVLAEEGFREMPDLQKNLEHELAELLYAALLFADHYKIDLTEAFLNEINRLEKNLTEKNGE